MILQTLTADFGTLRGRTLELHPGLNILTLPNEGGKSTWTAFLTAMLYGIPTGERSTKASLSAKEHYQPWSGIPMAGQIELTWQGRHILLQRSSTKRQPLGTVQAWDRDSGELIPELCREDCGQVLLGVERAVFERSALIGQGKLPLTAAPELEQRLTACVTGDQETSCTQALKRLHDWQKDRSNPRQTGRLDQARREAAALETQLAEQQTLADQAQELESQLQAAQLELDRFNQELEALEQQQQAQLYELCQQAEQTMRENLARTQELDDPLLPEALALSVLETRLQNLAVSVPPAPSPMPQPPEPPAGFLHKPREQALLQAQQDADRIRQLQAQAKRPWLLFSGLTLAALALGLLAFHRPHSPALLILGGMGLLAGLGLSAFGFLQARRAKASQKEAQALLNRYGVPTPEALLSVIQDWQAAWQVFQDRFAVYTTETQQYENWKLTLSLLEQTLFPLGPAQGLDQCRQTLYQAIDRRRALDQAKEQAQSARETWERLSPLMSTEPPVLTQEAPKGPSPAASRQDTLVLALTAEETIRTLEVRLAALNAHRLEPADLEAQRLHWAELQQEIAALDREAQAIDLAMKALEQAQQSLQARFAPALAAQAGELLRQLTDGHYARLSLDRSMALTVQEAGAVLARSSLWLSGGTADQLFLAVRLALCRQLLPPDAPIVLDDAFVNFDDGRLTAALMWLAQEAEHRQILLFTCQGREQALWDRLRKTS